MTVSVPNLIRQLEQLIATPSISCTRPEIDMGNRAVIDLLATWLDDMGFIVTIQPINASGSKANLIATAGRGSEGLVLAGHVDTVPFDEHLWTSDAFTLTERDGRLYGLGTADMKSFFALVTEAIRDLDLARLQQPLIILATADEETSMAGARALTAENLRGARHAVIGEPTSMQPIRMHKGILMEAIRLTGQAGHSSNPALGNSALEAMHQVMGELLRWREELQAAHRNPLFDVPVPTMNFGHIHGGDNPNRICGLCELQIDIRPLPGMRLADLRHELDRRLAATLHNSGIQCETRALFDGVEAMKTDAGAVIVRAVEELTGAAADAAAYSTEGPFFNSLGMETVVLGPGRIQQAHQPDEYLDTRQIGPMVKVLQSLVERFCLGAGAG